MNITEKDPLVACRALKTYLSTTPLIDENAIVSASNIYVGSYPLSGLPEIFMTISLNGSVQDYGQLAQFVLILNLCVPLINGQVQDSRISYILSTLNDSLSDPINSIPDYAFSVADYNGFGTTADSDSGYSMTLININVKVF